MNIPLPHLDPVSLAATVAALALAATRLLATSKPLWDRLPPLLQGLFPVLVLVLPQVAAAALGVHTSIDFVNLVVLSVVLVLPGVHSHTVATLKPNGPGSVAAVGLLALSVSFGAGLGCSRLANVDWSAVAACGEQPAESALTQIISGVLAGTGDVKTELEGVAAQYGVTAVKCTTQQIIDDIGTAPVTARASRQAQRGRAFLKQVGP